MKDTHSNLNKRQLPSELIAEKKAGKMQLEDRANATNRRKENRNTKYYVAKYHQFNLRTDCFIA